MRVRVRVLEPDAARHVARLRRHTINVRARAPVGGMARQHAEAQLAVGGRLAGGEEVRDGSVDLLRGARVVLVCALAMPVERLALQHLWLVGTGLEPPVVDLRHLGLGLGLG